MKRVIDGLPFLNPFLIYRKNDTPPKEVDIENVPEAKRYLFNVSCKTLMRVIEKEYKLPKGALKQNRKHIRLKRSYIYLSRNNLQKHGHELSDELGGITPAVITRHYQKACQDIEEKTGSYPDIKGIKKLLRNIV